MLNAKTRRGALMRRWPQSSVCLHSNSKAQVQTLDSNDVATHSHRVSGRAVSSFILISPISEPLLRQPAEIINNDQSYHPM